MTYEGKTYHMFALCAKVLIPSAEGTVWKNASWTYLLPKGYLHRDLGPLEKELPPPPTRRSEPRL